MGPARERARGVPPAPLDLVARVVAVAADLMLGSKVEATLSAAGHEVTLSPSLQEAPLDGGRADRRRPRCREPGGAGRARGAGAWLLLARRCGDPGSGRGGGGRPGRAALADGSRNAGARRAPAQAECGRIPVGLTCANCGEARRVHRDPTGASPGRRPCRLSTGCWRRPWVTSQRGPGAEDRWVEGSGVEVREQGVQLGLLFGAVEGRVRRRGGRRGPGPGAAR